MQIYFYIFCVFAIVIVVAHGERCLHLALCTPSGACHKTINELLIRMNPGKE